MKTHDPKRPRLGFAVSIRGDSVSYARIANPDPTQLGCIEANDPVGAAMPLQPAPDTVVPGAVPCTGVEVLRELGRAHRHRELAPWIPLAGVFVVWIVITAAVLARGGVITVAASIVASVAVTWIAYRIAKRFDAAAGTSLLVYHLDAQSNEQFDALRKAMQKLAMAGRVWHIASEGRLLDPRQKYGARRFLRRYRIRPGLSTPARTLMNCRVPTIYGESRKYFFMPDRVLVFDDRGVRAMPYDRMTARTAEALVVEDEEVPSDARVVETTWLHIGPDGGPDPAVPNNRRYPIVLYGALELAGSIGAAELFHGSSPSALEAFADALDAMAERDDVVQGDERDEPDEAPVDETEFDETDDSFFEEALRYFVEGGAGDVGSFVKRFSMTFGSAARTLAALENDGFIGPLRNDGTRDVRRSAIRYIELLDRGTARPGDPARAKPSWKTAVRPKRGRRLEPHEVLGVGPAASRTDIAEAYKDLARLYHPDKVAFLAPEFQDLAEQRMKEINAAYAVLIGSSPTERRAGRR